jgi:hypothetical protein
VDQNTGHIVYNFPIVTGFAQNYLTDMTETLSIFGGQDRVAISGGLEFSWDYATTEPATIQLSVLVNRYVARPSFNNVYVSNLYFFDQQVATQQFNYVVDTNVGGITNLSTPLSPAPGTKAAFVPPAGGTLYPAFDQVKTGLSAQSPGTGTGANVEVALAYGTAATYDVMTNTQLTINAAGSNWHVGETILIPGTGLGGTTPANDMTLTVSGVSTVPTTVKNTGVIFPTVYDQPGRAGVYLYAIELQWLAVSGSATINNVQLNTRSISTQLIKP